MNLFEVLTIEGDEGLSFSKIRMSKANCGAHHNFIPPIYSFFTVSARGDHITYKGERSGFDRLIRSPDLPSRFEVALFELYTFLIRGHY